jgi:hypothetical protein
MLYCHEHSNIADEEAGADQTIQQQQENDQTQKGPLEQLGETIFDGGQE